MSWRRLVVGLILVAVAFGVTTVIALEGQEVVVVRTIDERGQVHDTRTWVAEDAQAIWIEAATPARPFAQDIARTGQAEIVRAGAVRRCAADIVANPEGHQHIRTLLARKYGWADWWIGLLQDTSTSVAVRCTKPDDQRS
jgi:hypothetical protein